MNPLTLIKRIQKINSTEAALGISEDASWHAKYKDSAYVYVGGVPYDLTEGDLLAVFAQYGEVVDVNLVRDKATGKSKGFAFLAYEDQRSTTLAVDNLNGANILGRTIRVDHVSKYKKKEEEDEEAEQQKREARGVCRAFQKGECSRGASCKFSHDEQRSANTGWGAKDDSRSRWGHDKYDGPPKTHEKSRFAISDIDLDSRVDHKDSKLRTVESDLQRSRKESDYGDGKRYLKDKDRGELERRSYRHEKEDPGRSREGKQSERSEKESPGRSRDTKWSERHGQEHFIRSRDEKKLGRHPDDANWKQDRERRSSRHDSESYMREEHGKRSHGYSSKYNEDKVRSDQEDQDIQRHDKRSRHGIYE